MNMEHKCRLLSIAFKGGFPVIHSGALQLKHTVVGIIVNQEMCMLKVGNNLQCISMLIL